MYQLPDLDVVALSRLGKLTNAERIGLLHTHSSFDGALASLGAIDIDLRDTATTIIEQASVEGVQTIVYGATNYPERLLLLEQPPLVVYVLGTMPSKHTPSVAVVGTRSCTVSYGKPVTDLLVKQWTEAGCVIVSGLAKGIDTLAHEACLRSGGSTIAVIASGIGRISPIAARHLAARIATNGGAVLCEYPFHVAALPPYFPARNRLIATLSDAVVIVESKATGGALITASFAHSQNIPVWSVPGPINSSRSHGTNALIASGMARPLTSGAELLSTLPMHVNPSPLTLAMREPDQRAVALGADPVTVDQAACAWKCSLPEAMILLFELEIEGYVTAEPGGRYRAC